MAGEWIDKSLGDLIDIKHGFAFKGEFFRDEPPGDILLTPGNFAVGGGFKADKFKYYQGPVPDEFVLHEGDLIVTMTDLSKNADTLGYPAFVPRISEGRRFLHNQRLGKVVAQDRTIVDLRYLHYRMCGSDYRHEVVASATGTTVKHTSPDRIKRFRFRLPPPPEQRAIACILGALDDKIELNRRRNKTLEATARAIFKSWFVDFDPVRAKATGQQPPGLKPEIAALFPDAFEDSELGEIPKGWRVGRLGETADEVRDGVDPSEIAPDTPYIALEHIPRRCMALDTWGVADGVASGKLRFQCGDILFGKLRPYFHKVGPAPIDGVCSTDVVVARPVSECWYGLVVGHMADDAFVAHTDRGSTGTKMPRTNWRDMSAYPVALPPPELAGKFTALLRPMLERIRRAIFESRALAIVRDALLPKLISGELRVRDAEKIAGKCV